jgi:hypothetical protein
LAPPTCFGGTGVAVPDSFHATERGHALVEIILELLADFFWQVVGELLLGTVVFLVDTWLVRRKTLPESWTKIQLIASVFSGPLAGYGSALLAPHRLGTSIASRVLALTIVPLLGGGVLAVFNGLVATEDRGAARRLGWVCGILFALGFLAGRRWGIG